MTSGIERQRHHFNAIAARYEEGRRDANHRRMKSLIWQSVKAELESLRGRTITMIEPMCGYAEGMEIVRDIFELDCEYFGFDYSDVIVEKLSADFSEGHVWQADATTYEPISENFDLVFLIGGLHHVPDHAREVVRNMAGGLKRNGMFISFEPTFGNPLFKFVREAIYRKNAIFDDQTERSFSTSELRELFTSAGLQEVRTFYPGLSAYIFYYNTYAFPFLNRGGSNFVDFFFRIDRLIMNTLLGKALSFATVSIWRKV